MTASSLSMTGASSSSDRARSQSYRQSAQSQGSRLQMRIAKAVQQHGDAGGRWVMLNGFRKGLSRVLGNSHA